MRGPAEKPSGLPLALVVFLQMLPATLLTPAIRPRFVELGGSEGAMHAFMSVNMVAAALIAPWLGHRIDKRASRQQWLAALCLLDALLLYAFTLPLPVPLVLALRFVEGGAHVGGATLLLSEALTLSRRHRDPALMGMAGAGIMAAVALGNALGALLVGVAVVAPFLVAGACALLAGAVGARLLRLDLEPAPQAAVTMRETATRLALPLSAVFVARFTIGCMVVTFALFAHHHHALSDRAVGGLFACLTVPFALLTYPATRILRRLPSAHVLFGSSALYALCLLSLPYVSTARLMFVMLLAGVASAGMFAAQLTHVAREAPSGAGGRGMALFNGAGCLGMLVGPIVAGITSALVRSAHGPLVAYRSVFLLAGGSVLLWCAAAALCVASARRNQQVSRLRLSVSE